MCDWQIEFIVKGRIEKIYHFDFIENFGITNSFNYIGLIFVVLLLIPNIVWAIKTQENRQGYKNKTVEVLEQIGRFGSMIFMVINIPLTFFGFYFDVGYIVYITVNSFFILAYYLAWLVFWKKDSIRKVLFLSIIPSALFIFSGIMITSIPLMIFGILFAVFHIFLSIKNSLQK